MMVNITGNRGHDKDQVSVEITDLNYVMYRMIDGDIHSQKQGNCFPSEMQDYICREVCRIMNVQANHDGYWVIYARYPKAQLDRGSQMIKPFMPSMLEAHWYDKDGDKHVEVELNNKPDFVDVIEVSEGGITSCAAVGHEAIQEVFNRYRDIEVSHTQTFKEAMGQAPSSGVLGFVPTKH
jgi:hypothetical protein